ncbi:hypothetical protein C8Q76DRAFT_831516 [Earliella scabrosa]|nr:hypothetical protein C8Q76DRAFT_831516 [Earliella scabrosa]
MSNCHCLRSFPSSDTFSRKLIYHLKVEDNYDVASKKHPIPLARNPFFHGPMRNMLANLPPRRTDFVCKTAQQIQRCHKYILANDGRRGGTVLSLKFEVFKETSKAQDSDTARRCAEIVQRTTTLRNIACTAALWHGFLVLHAPPTLRSLQLDCLHVLRLNFNDYTVAVKGLLDAISSLPCLRTVILEDMYHENTTRRADEDEPDFNDGVPIITSAEYFDSYLPWTIHAFTYTVGIDGEAAIPYAINTFELMALRVRMGALACNVWERAMKATDSVRLIELECSGSELPDLICLLTNAFTGSPLVDLPILALTLIGIKSPSQSPEDAEACRQELFKRAFGYLPSLRWIALAEPQCKKLDPNLDDYAGDRAPWRWWKVTRDDKGTPLEVTEVPGWEGERARAYLRAADKTAAEEFDLHFVPLH